MTESSINEQGSWSRAIPGAVYGQLWGIFREPVEWFDFYVYSFCSLYFAHIFSLQEIPLLNCYKPPEFCRWLPDAPHRRLAVWPHC